MKDRLLLSVLLAVLFFSCQTEIDVKLPTYYNKLVVEGYIENGEYPVVSLFRSAPYFSTMTMDYLFDSIIISNAKVTITANTGESQQLTLQLVPDAPLILAYTGFDFKGELNKTYTLTVEWNNKVYTSTTSILNTFDLDSIGFVPRFGRTEIDTAANIRITMKDNGQGSNYYQFKVKIHCPDFSDRVWIPTIPAAFDNSPFYGKTFNYEILRGSPSAIFMPEMSDAQMQKYFRGNYRVGDTVYVKYAKLDRSAYQFWQSANSDLTFGQNPFMSPTPIISNISCNTGEKCLGVWCGSAAKTVKLIFPAK